MSFRNRLHWRNGRWNSFDRKPWNWRRGNRSEAQTNTGDKPIGTNATFRLKFQSIWFLLIDAYVYLAFVEDAGVESVVEAVAFEFHLVRWRNSSVEGVVAQIVSIELMRKIGIPNVVDLRDSRQRRPGGNFFAIDQDGRCLFCCRFHLFLLARHHQRQS